MTDTITIKRNGMHDLICNKDQIESIRVKSNGYTSTMTADEFFKIINEAHQW